MEMKLLPVLCATLLATAALTQFDSSAFAKEAKKFEGTTQGTAGTSGGGPTPGEERFFCGDHTDTPRCCRRNGGYWVSLGAGDPGGCNFCGYSSRTGNSPN